MSNNNYINEGIYILQTIMQLVELCFEDTLNCHGENI